MSTLESIIKILRKLSTWDFSRFHTYLLLKLTEAWHSIVRASMVERNSGHILSFILVLVICKINQIHIVCLIQWKFFYILHNLYLCYWQSLYGCLRKGFWDILIYHLKVNWACTDNDNGKYMCIVWHKLYYRYCNLIL